MPILLSEKTEKFLERTCLFCQPWWLQAVSPDRWDVVVVERGGEVAAALPYAYKVRFSRYLLIEMPCLTPYLGPWLRPSNAKYTKRLGEEKELMTELIEKLPPFAVFNQGFHPSLINWLPFYWKGFTQTTRYTYVIEDTKNLEAVWNETRENIRTDTRKAEKQVEVIESNDIDRFLNLLRVTFRRQGKNLPFPEELIYRVERACANEGAHKMMFAIDADGRTHAAVYLVWDAHTVYYLMGAGDPSLRNSGATSLLIWKTIEFASSQRKSFDFEGSMVEPIERFFRAFGGRQVPYFGISKIKSHVVGVYRALWRWRHRRIDCKNALVE